VRITDAQFQEQLAAHRVRREALIAKIFQDFAGVTRVGGISWSEASARDDYKTSEKELAEAGSRDTESSWEELVDSDNFWPEVLHGGFNFLDPIGFHYYLAPAMVRGLRTCQDLLRFEFDRQAVSDDDFKMMGYPVWVVKGEFPFFERYPDRYARLSKERERAKWSQLTPAQKECVTEYKAVLAESETWGYDQYLSGRAPQ
jgi:hypothetical protein